MIEIKIDTTGLETFAKNFEANSHKAMTRAFKAEGFRLKTVVADYFTTGMIGPRSPLAEAEAKEKGNTALRPFGKFVAYQVKDNGPGDIQVAIGFSKLVGRKRSPEGRKRQLVALFGGGPHTITRKKQNWIAYKLRKRLGEPVLQRFLDSGTRDRKPPRKGSKWEDLKILLPRVGKTLIFPERDFVKQITYLEKARTIANISKIYLLKMQGGSFKKEWWNESGDFDES